MRPAQRRGGESGGGAESRAGDGKRTLKRSGAVPEAPPAGRGQSRPADPVGDHLRSLDRDELVSLVEQEAAENPGLAGALNVRAQLARGGRLRVAAIEKLIVRSTVVRSPLKVTETARLAREIDEAAHLVDLVVRSDAPEAAIGLTELALKRMEGLWYQVDDSKGRIAAASERFARLHLEACKAARMDPAAFAQRLFELEVRAGSAPFVRAAERYADVLGPAGLAAYRTLLTSAWAEEASANRAGGQRHEFDFVSRYAITQATAALARATGDVDLAIEVESRDLRTPDRFMAIATLCRDHGRPADALSWAERGVRAFPHGAAELRAFVIEAHLAGSRVDDAMRLAWERFTTSPDAETYRALRRYGIRAGAWADWHDRAVDRVRKAAEAARAADGSIVPGVHRTNAVLPAGSALVAVLLADDRLEEALEAARTFGCAVEQWMELAGRCEAAAPEEAVAIYRARVGEMVKIGDLWYPAAVDALKKLRDLMATLDRTDEFEGFALDIRRAHERQWTFVALFDRAALVPKERAQLPRSQSDLFGGRNLRSMRGGRG